LGALTRLQVGTLSSAPHGVEVGNTHSWVLWRLDATLPDARISWWLVGRRVTFSKRLLRGGGGEEGKSGKVKKHGEEVGFAVLEIMIERMC
jgi:hypothetical protein